MEPRPSFTSKQKWHLAGTMIGGVLIHLSLGTVYTFGNFNPYLTSYMRNHSAPSLTYTECSWVFALSLIGQGTAMTFGGLLEKKIGLRLASLTGCWLMSLGVFLSYIAVQHSFGALVITYGLMFGMGTGLAYALPLSCAMRWIPHRKGLMNGIIVAGFGGGAFIFDQVQKEFINPHDKKATLKIGDDKYFTQSDVLDQVPKMFLVSGGCFAVMQLIGCSLLTNPPSAEERHELGGMAQRYHILQEEIEEENESSSQVNGSEKEDDIVSLTPLQTLKTVHFYIIFFTFFFMGQGIVFISTLYKAYGLTFISDDTFLSWTGAFAAVFNGFGRIFWGSISDRFSYKVASMIMAATFTCLMLTFQLCELGGKPLFFIYVVLLFGTFSGSFSLFPTATAKCFGPKYMAMNYGLVFFSNSLTAPIGVFLSHKLQSSLGWNGLFFYVAGSSFVAFLLAFAFNAKDNKNKNI